jgi:hypothetical protein
MGILRVFTFVTRAEPKMDFAENLTRRVLCKTLFKVFQRNIMGLMFIIFQIVFKPYPPFTAFAKANTTGLTRQFMVHCIYENYR